MTVFEKIIEAIEHLDFRTHREFIKERKNTGLPLIMWMTGEIFMQTMSHRAYLPQCRYIFLCRTTKILYGSKIKSGMRFSGRDLLFRRLRF